MISNEDIEAQLKTNHDIEYVSVHGDGKHFELTVVSDVFVGKPKVKRQMWVYSLLSQHIASGTMHAVHMNTWTKSEWEKRGG